MTETAARNKEQRRGMNDHTQPTVSQFSCPVDRRVVLAGLGAGLLGGLAVPAQARTLPLLAQVVQRLIPPQPAPTVPFTTGTGQSRMLTAYRGDGVVLNLWATWCLPCKAEMPALDHLAQIVAAARIMVLPVSIDSGGRKVVAAFYRENRMRIFRSFSIRTGAS